ncbi:MAG TPA: DNA polymerase III subunit beta, partial [Gammaproteobacteria bacterium]|nr:DNA polymerase III subunit beta [Gammaproteobacteria bacterium]
MRFSIQRESLLKPMQQVVGVVERRQTLPVLANLLVQVREGRLSLTGTDLEVEMRSSCAVDMGENGETTVPARKWFDLVRALPDGVKVDVQVKGDRVVMHAGRSRYTLSSLPADEFPTTEEIEVTDRVLLQEGTLRRLMERTAFAMANQDVRYYLNGLLLDLRGSELRCVATDGHRMAMSETALGETVKGNRQLIVPRKGVTELLGLFESGEGEVGIEFSANHIRVQRDDVVFTSKLIDGKFPDYEAVVPLGADKLVQVGRETLRNALQRAAILSNEKYRGVRLEVSPNCLRIIAHNPEQEEAFEEIEAETKVGDIAIGFNVGYLLDALGSLDDEQVHLQLRDAQSSCLLRGAANPQTQHVV